MKNRVKESLMPNEQIVKEAEFSKILFTPGILLFALMLIGSLAADSFSNAVTGIFGGLVVAVILSIPAIKLLVSNTLAVTDKKIFGRIGLIKTVEMNSPIHQIQNVKVSNGLLGKIFKYGTVNITTTSGVYDFKYIKNPNEFKNTVMAQISRSEEAKMDLHAQKIADAIKNTKN